ncbi:glycoside hydrolase family protein [uncultured Bartonella sp.]|uniref:lysozyme n=1 Tax=uncultured Bartonella sp. TaxID=104108 RepID=UPI0025F236C1|nr:glycoside hydrolase family protein [uncultured Bartonella sp.]
MTRKISEHGLAKLKQWEGLRTKAYRDDGGVWTIGYGHTAMAGAPKPHAGMVISAEDAEKILLKDLVQYEAAVESLVKVELNDNQFAALVSFVYNIPLAKFKKSTLLKKLNSGNYDAVPNELMKWINVDRKKNQGLVNRRRAEGYLWMEGAFVASKNVVPEQKTVHPLLTPEVIGPVGSAVSGAGAIATGSGPVQWALAAAMVICVAIFMYCYIKRMREEEA